MYRVQGYLISYQVVYRVINIHQKRMRIQVQGKEVRMTWVNKVTNMGHGEQDSC